MDSTATTIQESSNVCKTQPKAAQNSPEQARADQSSPEQRRTAQSSPESPEQPRTVQSSPEQPRTAQNSPEQPREPRTAQNSPEQPRTGQSSPEQPRAKCTINIRRRTARPATAQPYRRSNVGKTRGKTYPQSKMHDKYQATHCPASYRTAI